MSAAPALRSSNRRAWYVAVLAGMASYLDAALLVSTGIALVLYAPVLGLSGGTIGVLSSLLTFSFAVGAIIGGRLGDRFGRRRVYSVTIVTLAVACAVLAAAVTPGMLFAGVVLAGLAVGADLPVSLALIAEQAPEGRRGRMVAFSAILWIGGIAATSLIATLVGGMGATGARILYVHLAVVAVAVLVLRARIPESGEWAAARTTSAATLESDTIRLDSLRQLGRRPFLASLVATGLFYAIWNMAANTIGQFGTYLYVNVAHASVQVASLIGLISLPLGIVAGLVFMRIVDRSSRSVWFTVGAVLQIVAFGLPLVAGAHLWSLAVMSLLFGIGSAFAGEAMYKVWSQELFPTLLRGTAQGATIAFARVIAALGALATPLIATNSPMALFAVLLGCVIVSSVIGLAWVRRLREQADSELSDSKTTIESTPSAAVSESRA